MSNKSELRKVRKNYHEFMGSTQQQRKQRDKQRTLAQRNMRGLRQS